MILRINPLANELKETSSTFKVLFLASYLAIRKAPVALIKFQWACKVWREREHIKKLQRIFAPLSVILFLEMLSDLRVVTKPIILKRSYKSNTADMIFDGEILRFFGLYIDSVFGIKSAIASWLI